MASLSTVRKPMIYNIIKLTPGTGNAFMSKIMGSTTNGNVLTKWLEIYRISSYEYKKQSRVRNTSNAAFVRLTGAEQKPRLHALASEARLIMS